MKYSDYTEGARALKARLGDFRPEILLVLGSGLGSLGDVSDSIQIPYNQIPHMRISTATGHAGRFVACELSGRRVLMMQGRLHVYEGYTAEETAFPIRISHLIGIDKVILTCAVGGVNTTYHIGDLMAITDHIKFAWPDPLIGPNISEFGERFPDMSHIYDPEFIDLLRDSAKETGELMREGIYYYTTGPQYETPAEIRAIRAIGGDAVGMSTVHEAIAARHCGMRVAAVALISNMAAGVLDKPLSGEEVIKEGKRAADRFEKLIRTFITKI